MRLIMAMLLSGLITQFGAVVSEDEDMKLYHIFFVCWSMFSYIVLIVYFIARWYYGN